MKKIYVAVYCYDGELLRAFYEADVAESYAKDFNDYVKDFNDVDFYTVRIEEVELYEI